MALISLHMLQSFHLQHFIHFTVVSSFFFNTANVLTRSQFNKIVGSSELPLPPSFLSLLFVLPFCKCLKLRPLKGRGLKPNGDGIIAAVLFFSWQPAVAVAAAAAHIKAAAASAADERQEETADEKLHEKPPGSKEESFYISSSPFYSATLTNSRM